ncbi:hypothetical protein VP01_2778g3 [Puccinia sorghi]|uniref:Uncharacterized protein n=1 Tax=Puccinia sorghi TaxID=27349 RepID=A0A0L6V4J3_9BASI|nr:hypothetical protein VP01_2778g3 [Puccinia sorghi]
MRISRLLRSGYCYCGCNKVFHSTQHTHSLDCVMDQSCGQEAHETALTLSPPTSSHHFGSHLVIFAPLCWASMQPTSACHNMIDASLHSYQHAIIHEYHVQQEAKRLIIRTKSTNEGSVWPPQSCVRLGKVCIIGVMGVCLLLRRHVQSTRLQTRREINKNKYLTWNIGSASINVAMGTMHEVMCGGVSRNGYVRIIFRLPIHLCNCSISFFWRWQVFFIFYFCAPVFFPWKSHKLSWTCCNGFRIKNSDSRRMHRTQVPGKKTCQNFGPTQDKIIPKFVLNSESLLPPRGSQSLLHLNQTMMMDTWPIFTSSLTGLRLTETKGAGTMQLPYGRLVMKYQITLRAMASTISILIILMLEQVYLITCKLLKEICTQDSANTSGEPLSVRCDVFVSFVLHIVIYSNTIS